MFLKNVWQVAAFSAEIKDTPLPRTLLGEDVVLYRTATGAPAALLDECPHRLTPLSLGKVIDGVLQCGYHGMRFNSAGACVHAPGQEESLQRRKCAASQLSNDTPSYGFGWAIQPRLTRRACRIFSG